MPAPLSLVEFCLQFIARQEFIHNYCVIDSQTSIFENVPDILLNQLIAQMCAFGTLTDESLGLFCNSTMCIPSIFQMIFV